MTYTILIPLLITLAAFIHFHHRNPGYGWCSRTIHSLMNLGLALTMNVGTWAVRALAMWGLA